jgi:hypothetical protein
MRNPWLKKDPAMSMFLSAANAWMGAARGQASAALKRGVAGAVKAPAKKRRRRRA